MAIYILAIAILIVLSIFEYKKVFSKSAFYFFYIVTLMFLGFVAAFRSVNVGADTWMYYETFTWYYDIGWDFSTIRFEIGYSIFCKLLTYISDSPQILLIVTSLFINTSIGVFIYKNSPKKFLSLLIYVLLGYWMNYMNVMREAMAISIVLLGYPLAKRKGLFSFIVYETLVLLAITFHTVAIFAAIIPLLKFFKPTKYSFILALFLGIFMFTFARSIFSVLVSYVNKYSGYASNKFSESNYFGTVLNLLFGIFIASYYFYANRNNFYRRTNGGKLIKTSTNVEININTGITIVYIVSLFMVVQMAIFNRVASIFSIFNIVLVPISLENLKSKNEKNMKYALIFVMLTYFFVIAIFRPEWTGCIPYEFY